MKSYIFNIKIEQPANNSLNQQFDHFEEWFDEETNMIEKEPELKREFELIHPSERPAKTLLDFLKEGENLVGDIPSYLVLQNKRNQNRISLLFPHSNQLPSHTELPSSQ
jgi:hypothetical protein